MDVPIKLYLDEDAQRTDLIQGLRARHVDLVTASESGLLGQSDEVQLEYATAQGRVIFTFNRGDFFRLHTEWLTNTRQHTGIIVSDQVQTGVVVRQLLRLMSTKSASEMKDALEFLSHWR